MLKVLVVEDHVLVLEGIEQILTGLEDSVQVLCGQDADAGIKLLDAHADIDLVVLDLMLPGVNGMTLLGMIRKRYPAVPVVVLSALDDPGTVAKAMRLGASGYVPKSSPSDSLLDALRAVLAGDVYLPAKLRDAMEHGESGHGKSLNQRYRLTNAQMNVLELLAQGNANRKIAESLGIGEGTVKIHITAIFKALKVTNRTQALLVAKRYGFHGLSPLPEVRRSNLSADAGMR